MRQRVFKLIFLACVCASMACILLLSGWMIAGEASVDFLDLFVPVLACIVLALALSGLLAAWGSRSFLRPLGKIDISRPDERDVEEEIKPLIRRLNDQNRQIRSQMEALAQEHERQDRMRREFTANVSHELKTPLTSISGFAELLRDGMVRPEDVRPFAGKIYEETQRLISLVGDIIRLSRLEDSSVTVRMEPVCLYDTAQRVQQQLADVAKKMNVSFRLSGDRGQIVASARIAQEIIYNLCDNAVKYNRPGGSVDVRIAEEADCVRLTVSDTGIGVAKEELQRIFERFYRVDKSHSKEVGGTGLGLSIVKHGAACLGAELTVDSELGSGTTISVDFPKRAGHNSGPDA